MDGSGDVDLGLVKSLGQRVRDIRKVRGLSQRELGERLGVGHNAVANLEARGVERISTLEAVAAALDCGLVLEIRERAR